MVIDKQAELTEKLTPAMVQYNRTFRTIAYFIRKAYPNSKAKRNRLRLNNI